jgi:hypothetical protein
MDARYKKVKCLNCGDLFLPDHRNRGRQKYCRKPGCRKASKAASQKRWLSKPENQNYFRGTDSVQRVQRWRQDHPGYWRRKQRSGTNALQDPLMAQPSENKPDIAKSPKTALQDLLIEQPFVLIGLISNFTGTALQDDIAMTVDRLQQLGRDIVSATTPTPGGRHGIQTSHCPRSCPKGPPPVQLARSSPGP